MMQHDKCVFVVWQKRTEGGFPARFPAAVRRRNDNSGRKVALHNVTCPQANAASAPGRNLISMRRQREAT